MSLTLKPWQDSRSRTEEYLVGTENKAVWIVNTPNRFAKNKLCLPYFFHLQVAGLVEQRNAVAPV